MSNNMYDEEKLNLPKFPRTQHLPLEPNAQRDDLIASLDDLKAVLNSEHITVEEKVDASNVGFYIDNDGQLVIRNRNHILNRAYTGAKDNPSKTQFAPIWTHLYTELYKIEELYKKLGFRVALYGEWMFARHTVYYNQLPSYLLIFDIYDIESKKFLSPTVTYPLLDELDIKRVHTLVYDSKVTTNELLKMRDGKSFYSDENKEGIYIKVSDGDYITHRYKMVRPNFIQGEHWNKEKLVKNLLKK